MAKQCCAAIPAVPQTAVDLACFIFLPSQLLQKVQFKQKKYVRKAVILGTHFERKLADLSKEEETMQEHVGRKSDGSNNSWQLASAPTPSNLSVGRQLKGVTSSVPCALSGRRKCWVGGGAGPVIRVVVP